MNDYVKVKVEGKNINNYIKWLITQKINIIDLKVKKHNLLEVIINYSDYGKLLKYSKTYQIEIIEKYGKLRLIDIIKHNLIIFLCLILAIIFLYFMSNIIFSVDVIYSDAKIVSKLTDELRKYNIKKYTFKKKYEYLETVKKEILQNNKDYLEWLEIEESGTKYIIKIVERKQEPAKKEYKYQSISAAKNAIISNIKAYSGEKIKLINEYVKKDETIISGLITKPNGEIILTKAKGIILGEVWYKVNIEYPFYYHEEKITGKNKNYFAIEFLNSKIFLLPSKKYRKFNVESTTIIENNVIPIKLIKERQYEVVLTEEIYTNDEVTDKAIAIAKEKLLSSNKKIDKIIKTEILNKESINSKVKLELFISVIEDITKITEIEENN